MKIRADTKNCLKFFFLRKDAQCRTKPNSGAWINENIFFFLKYLERKEKLVDTRVLFEQFFQYTFSENLNESFVSRQRVFKMGGFHHVHRRFQKTENVLIT